MYLETMRHKLAMALEAADFLPWRYNLAEGKTINESKVHPGEDRYEWEKIQVMAKYDLRMARDRVEELFHQHKPQLILMDIKMLVMDGYEAAAEIRKTSACVPIIAVTAYAFAQDKQRIINSGFDAYTAKPINGKILKDKISTLLTHQIILM